MQGKLSRTYSQPSHMAPEVMGLLLSRLTEVLVCHRTSHTLFYTRPRMIPLCNDVTSRVERRFLPLGVDSAVSTASHSVYSVLSPQELRQTAYPTGPLPAAYVETGIPVQFPGWFLLIFYTFTEQQVFPDCCGYSTSDRFLRVVQGILVWRAVT